MTEKPSFNEAHLISEAQSGDAQAFGRLYDHYLPRIYRFIFFKVTNQHDAEDICQHVFMSAWQNIRSYRDTGHSFSSWVYRIARNAVIDFYRTSKPTIDLASVAHAIPDTADLQRELGVTLEAERVVQALAKLTDDHREVIIMRFVEDMNNKEVAQVLGRSNGAVRVLQYRALKNLQSILEQEESERYKEA